jgi:hypothetical protein
MRAAAAAEVAELLSTFTVNWAHVSRVTCPVESWSRCAAFRVVFDCDRAVNALWDSCRVQS